MSKESKPADRWAQVFSAATDRKGFCPGCGYHPAVNNGAHRADCTVERRGWCPGCLAHLPTFGQHRADCTAREENSA